MVYHISKYQMGDVLAVPCELAGERYFHYGMANDKGGVIHSSKVKRGVVEESVLKFSEGKPIKMCREITSADKLSAYERARSSIGKPYNAVFANCEHFVRWAHGMEKESWQIQKYGLVVTGAAFAVKGKGGYANFAGIGGAIGAYLTPEGENPAPYALAGIVGGIIVAAIFSK